MRILLVNILITTELRWDASVKSSCRMMKEAIPLLRCVANSILAERCFQVAKIIKKRTGLMSLCTRQELDLMFQGDSSDHLSNPGENNDLPSASPATAPTEVQNHSQSIFSATDQVKLQRSMSDGAMPVPSPIYVDDTVRTYANPLSYIGGPRLLTANLERASKESVLSIDE